MSENKTVLKEATKILDSSNDKLTLRALFYKLVGINVIENHRNEYQRLSRIMKKARMDGILPFDCIDDRSRTNIFPSYFDDIEELLRASVSSYKIDCWENQDCYIEVLVEKDTLISTFEKPIRQYRVNLSTTRGYNSLTELYNLKMRLKDKEDDGKDCHVFYIGDLDPSGLDMDRDIQKRLSDLGVNPVFKRILLNIDDIKKYGLAPNRIKDVDPRAKNYPYDDCWEVDAMDSEDCRLRLVSNILDLIDLDRWEESKLLEQQSKEELKTEFDKMKGNLN